MNQPSTSEEQTQKKIREKTNKGNHLLSPSKRSLELLVKAIVASFAALRAHRLQSIQLSLPLPLSFPVPIPRTLSLLPVIPTPASASASPALSLVIVSHLRSSAPRSIDAHSRTAGNASEGREVRRGEGGRIRRVFPGEGVEAEVELGTDGRAGVGGQVGGRARVAEGRGSAGRRGRRAGHVSVVTVVVVSGGASSVSRRGVVRTLRGRRDNVKVVGVATRRRNITALGGSRSRCVGRAVSSRAGDGVRPVDGRSRAVGRERSPAGESSASRRRAGVGVFFRVVRLSTVSGGDVAGRRELGKGRNSNEARRGRR
jgi:hypothetical protein